MSRKKLVHAVLHIYIHVSLGYINHWRPWYCPSVELYLLSGVLSSLVEFIVTPGE